VSRAGFWLKGGWRKRSADAKFWSFFVSSLFASFWGVTSWLLLKKICLALTKNMLHGMANAIVNIVIYSVDLCIFLFKRPLALTVFNLAQSLCATANLATIITVSVPTMSSEHKAKMDTLGPVVMWMSICSSAILILLLTLGPIWAGTSSIAVMVSAQPRNCTSGTGPCTGNDRLRPVHSRCYLASCIVLSTC